MFSNHSLSIRDPIVRIVIYYIFGRNIYFTILHYPVLSRVCMCVWAVSVLKVLEASATMTRFWRVALMKAEKESCLFIGDGYV